MDKLKIVLIEDEQEIINIITSYLNEFGYELVAISDGKKALEYIQSESANNTSLYILDRMLPGISGIEILKFIRLYKESRNTPVLILTALSTPEQIIEGLDAGADDYMTKPFDLNVLSARMRTLLRRNISTPSANKKELKHGDLSIDLDQCKAFIKSNPIDLTLSEFKLLECFLKTPGKVYTRNQLVEYIQDGPVHVTDRTIDTHIFGLRKKLSDYGPIIETIRGVGYRVSSNDKI
jgi:DNA-binding response OmpR family regulator